VKRDAWMEANVGARIQRIDHSALESDLDAQGWSMLRKLLSSAECDEIAALYAQDQGFRSRVVMARHGFGKGEYRYFKYPLPDLILTSFLRNL
jgi:hypothetical protein